MGIKDYLSRLQHDDWLTPALEEYDVRVQETEHWEEPVRFLRPSAVGTPCVRDAELSMLGYRSAIGPKQRARMDNGTDAHTRWAHRFEDSGLAWATELRLTKLHDGSSFFGKVPPELDSLDISWSGQVDALLTRPGGDPLVVYLGDVKTASRFVIAKVPDQEDPSDTARRWVHAPPKFLGKYPRQLASYWQAFSEALPSMAPVRLAPEAFLLFENTDTQEYLVRWLRFDTDVLHESLKVGVLSTEQVRAGRLSVPPFVRNGLTCRDCSREKVCYALQDGDEESWAKVNRALKITGRSG